VEINKTFRITYYSNKDQKHITRQGKWDSQCRYWTSKIGASLMTYFDMDAQGYRTVKELGVIHMTPRTEKKVARIIKEMKQEKELLFIMATEISVL
jgi:hypothetical protein